MLLYFKRYVPRFSLSNIVMLVALGAEATPKQGKQPFGTFQRAAIASRHDAVRFRIGNPPSSNSFWWKRAIFGRSPSCAWECSSVVLPVLGCRHRADILKLCDEGAVAGDDSFAMATRSFRSQPRVSGFDRDTDW